MTDPDKKPAEGVDPAAGEPATRAFTPEAQRALAEAAERRQAAEEAAGEAAAGEAPKEVDGRGGLDPVRYGDWEIKGLTSDF